MAQCKDTGALCVGRKKSIGMYADKQIGLDLARFLHTHMQRYKVIGIARQKGAHGTAFDGGDIDAIAQFHGNL